MGCQESKDLRNLNDQPLMIRKYCKRCDETSTHTLNIYSISLESSIKRPSIPVCGMCNNCNVIHCMRLSWIPETKMDTNTIVYNCVITMAKK